MRRRKNLVALIASAVLGTTAALGVAACGDSEGSRENVERGNLGNSTSQGPAPSTVETGPTRIQPTAPSEPEVTQPQTGP